MPPDSSDSPAALCPSCGAPCDPADQFCESCGAVLGSPASASVAGSAGSAASTVDDIRTHVIRLAASTCAACGGALDPDRWCTQCGLRAPSERDHWSEQPSAWVSGVCDRGIRHARNEDAMAIAALAAPGSFAALVVCDGVTTAAESDKASLAAARAARDVLAGGPRDGDGDSPAARIVHWTTRLEAATAAANRAASAVAAQVTSDLEPPSCTFVAAVLEGALLTVGWVGDSRAYWLADEGQVAQLSVDDSWATDQIAAGMAREVAEADPRAHSITRWLGADSHDAVARCASLTVDGPGWLLVCSDGLWNYCSSADEMRRLVAATVAERSDDPLVLAQGLVDFANGQGGHDNITVALARVPAASD